jgi:Protein of unknown function (DUF3152)
MRGCLLFIVLLAVSCTGSPPPDAGQGRQAEGESPPSPQAGSLPSAGSEGSAKKAAEPGDKPVVVEYMLVRKVHDAATARFAQIAEATLEAARGWQRADFDLVRRKRARFKVVLAEGATVDRLCFPYNTRELYSCQNGPVVALNADRWRTGTPEWTGTLAGYRRMLVNHEVGHLLGQHHPKTQCPQPGHAAPIMAQQSTELNGCLPNPWPLPHEIRRAARHDLPLAPPFEE